MLGHHIHAGSNPVAGQVADARQVVGCEHHRDARQCAGDGRVNR
jgi:hypothetical protein